MVALEKRHVRVAGAEERDGDPARDLIRTLRSWARMEGWLGWERLPVLVLRSLMSPAHACAGCTCWTRHSALHASLQDAVRLTGGVHALCAGMHPAAGGCSGWQCCCCGTRTQTAWRRLVGVKTLLVWAHQEKRSGHLYRVRAVALHYLFRSVCASSLSETRDCSRERWFKVMHLQGHQAGKSPREAQGMLLVFVICCKLCRQRVLVCAYVFEHDA